MFTYGLIILLLMIKWGESNDKLCEKLIPALKRFQRGIDIAKLDLMSIGPDEAEDGFRNNVVAYTCNQGKEIEYPPPDPTRPDQPEKYDEPDQINAISGIYAAASTDKVKILKSRNDVRKLFKAETGLSDSLGLFSLSGSFNKMMSSVSNKSVYLERADHVKPVYDVRMRSARSITMSEDAEKFMEDLPKTFEEDPGLYQEFIDEYGTHYHSDAKFGGVVRVLLETNSKYYEKKSDLEVEAAAKGTIQNILSAKGSSSGGSNKVDDEFTKNTAKTTRVFGGVKNLFEKDKGFKDWVDTVADRPYLYKGKLKEIALFFKDRSKKKAIKRAVQVHRGKAHLRAARKLVEAKLPTMKGDKDGKEKKLKGYLAKCDELIEQNNPDKKEVIRLSKDIEEALSWENISRYCKRKLYREYPCQNGLRVGCDDDGICWKLCTWEPLGALIHWGWRNVKHQNGDDMKCSSDKECVQKGAGYGKKGSKCYPAYLSLQLSLAK